MRMRTPSRRMPAAREHKASWLAWAVLGALLIGLVTWTRRQPYILLFLAAFGAIVWLGMIFDARDRRCLAATRGGESICDFASGFDCRKWDTWVVRALYEELSQFLSVDGRAVSVRPTDRCEEDLKVDLEDLDDLARDIAFRARRSMDDCHKNPLYAKVKTVGDIVTFLEYQPQIVEPSASPNGGPAMPSADSGAAEGPPSVS